MKNSLNLSRKENKFIFQISLLLIIILLLIPFIYSAETTSTPAPSSTGNPASTASPAPDAKNPLQQTMDSSKGVDWSKTTGGGQRATFSGANNQLTYNSGGKSYTLSSVSVPAKGFSQGYVEFDKNGNPVGGSYQMGEKGSAQVIGNTEAYIPGGSKVDWKGSDAKINLPATNEGVKGEPKTVANGGNDVKIHYDNTGKTKFLDDKGTERFELRGKSDEITYNSKEKGWQIESGKSINANGVNIPVGDDKAAVKFFSDGKIPDGEKSSSVGLDIKNKNLVLKGSSLESSPKIEIKGENDFFNQKGEYFSAQAGKGSSLNLDYNGKNFVVKPSGNIWDVIDGNKRFLGRDGEVLTETLKTPPSGMSPEEFKNIKSQGLEIYPVDDKGKSIITDSSGKEYKIAMDSSNNYKVVPKDTQYDPRVIYGENPPSGPEPLDENPNYRPLQVPEKQPVPYNPNNPHGWDLKTPPDFSKLYGPEHSFRTKNFIVESAGNARAYAEALEYYRWRNSIESTGKAMPDWPKPAVVTLQTGDHLGAGGATTFTFQNGEVFDWRMSIQGSNARLLDSVIPHEVQHMVSASDFREPLPRWIDEGLSTLTEHPAELDKHRQMLPTFLRSGRGIAFNQMMTMMDYPPDYMPLYAEGYSVVQYMALLKGKQEIINTANEAMKAGNTNEAWESAIRNHYGFQNLGEFQNKWNDWVRAGQKLK